MAENETYNFLRKKSAKDFEVIKKDAFSIKYANRIKKSNKMHLL